MTCVFDDGFGYRPCVVVVDVHSLCPRCLKQKRSLPYSRTRFRKAFTGKDIEIRVLLEPRLEILSSYEIIGIMIYRLSILPIESRLVLSNRKKAIAGIIIALFLKGT